MNRRIYLAGCLLAFSLNLLAATPALDSEQKKLSYAIGALFGSNVALETEMDVESFLDGIRDVLNKTPLKLSNEEMQTVITTYRDKQVKLQGDLAQQNAAAGKKFLAENGKKEGVQTTGSGLQYKVIEQGDGKKPGLADTVLVHYRGTLIDGTEFDSSYSRGEPTPITLNKVIKGWQEALTLMPEGSKWQVYVPSDLAYGDKAVGAIIQPNSTLIFDIELLKIQ